MAKFEIKDGVAIIPKVSNFEIDSFKDCRNLKAIYVPKNKVDYYKERFPADMHWLIV